jgi:hypothetical protein
MTTKDFTDYLNTVREALGSHPQVDDIIQELHDHIWDSASNISKKTGYSVQEAFKIALREMEDPNILATNFLHDQGNFIEGNWREPKSVLPEKKLTGLDFLILAVIGILASTALVSLVSWISQISGSSLDPLNFTFTLIQFIFIVAILVGYFYYKDEQEFKDQLENLRKRFNKIKEKEPISDETKYKFSAFGIHMQGFFQTVWAVVFFIGVLYVTFIAQWKLFNDYWYSIGLILMTFLMIFEVIQGTIKMVVGEIRVSRLIYSTNQMFMVAFTVIIILFYPFEFNTWLPAITNPNWNWVPDLIFSLTNDPDYVIKTGLGILAIFALMDGIYNINKFGKWKPSYHKSLVFKQPTEE